jgi:hypothetical protein
VQAQLPRLLSRLAAVVALYSGTVATIADTVTLLPIADATIYEVKPTNSLGGVTWFSSGTTQNFTKNRGLLKFDVAGAIPRGSTILGVNVTVSVTQVPRDGYAGSYFSLRRMLVPWGEGTNLFVDPQAPGFGSPAQTNDATWLSPFAHTTNTWSEPGGQEGVDFSGAISALVVIETIDSYPFESLSPAVEDVQLWLDAPSQNHGWMLKCEGEEQNFTARRFGSRELEDPSTSPTLTIDFQPPPSFSSITPSNGAVALALTLEAGHSYRLEYRELLPATNGWNVLTNFGAVNETTNLTVFDAISGSQRFYRISRD